MRTNQSVYCGYAKQDSAGPPLWILFLKTIVFSSNIYRAGIVCVCGFVCVCVCVDVNVGANEGARRDEERESEKE